MRNYIFFLFTVSFFLFPSLRPGNHSTANAAQTAFYGHLQPKALYNFGLAFGVYPALNEEKATMIYFPGFADAFRNHEALFAKWQAEGITVFAFDYPDHGGSIRLTGQTINTVKFSTVMDAAMEMYQALIPESDKPLFLSGWSTGGLIAARLIQSPRLRSKLSKLPAGVVLLSPAISAKPCIGASATHEQFTCLIPNHETLTHDESLWKRGAIEPSNAIEAAGFIAQLFVDGPKMFNLTQGWPNEVPVFIATADDDRYVFSDMTEKWRSLQERFWGMQAVHMECEGSFHEVDNDTDYGAEAVRMASAVFLRQALSGNDSLNLTTEIQSGPSCKQIE